jgi:uncharacterized membrane protein YfcA
LDFLAAGGAALAAGGINAMAGGGTLVSFPTLTAIGVPAVAAKVTNTVALCPGYLAGTYAQRDDLAAQGQQLRWLSLLAAIGGLAGAVLLDVTPEHAFRSLVPYLILLSCFLLLSQDRIRVWLTRADSPTPPADGGSVGPGGSVGRGGSGGTGGSGGPGGSVVTRRHAVPMGVAVLFSAIYGGFFGAGMGIMLLALLGLFSDERLVRLNALKQALSFVVNVVAAVCFSISGHVRWELVPVMAVAALIGGGVGGRLSQKVNATILRRVVVVAGTAIAISFWVG